jgi:hypothetical protein
VIGELALGLLGRHELRRAGHLARSGDGHVVHRPCKAEIGDPDPLDAVLQQDVRRLDVPMDDSVPVGGSQPGGNLLADAEDLRQLELSLAVDLLLERLTIDKLHGQDTATGPLRRCRWSPHGRD